MARFYTRGSRVEESESCRSELSQLPLGRRWPWYEERIRELGFTFRDATWSASDRARFGLERNGLCFRLEIVCDSGGRIASLLTDPHL